MDSKDVDALLEASCDGLLAMDPRTTFPFWDYDMAPLFSAQWTEKMFAAMEALRPLRPRRSDWIEALAGPSVLRKELVYCLFDLKAARIDCAGRMRYLDFWASALETMCDRPWFTPGENRVLSTQEMRDLVEAPAWRDASPQACRNLAELTVALNALAYGLYSDVFVHQCAEIIGPYPIADAGGGACTLLIRRWSNLKPMELWPGVSMLGPDAIDIVDIYAGTVFYIDIYNHLTWPGPTQAPLRRYLLTIDGQEFCAEENEISNLAAKMARRAQGQFRLYDDLSFEEKKVMWVRQRNFQFRALFAMAGLPWRSEGMEAAVRGAPLFKSPYWDMSRNPARLRAFWRDGLDPREDTFLVDWPGVYRRYFP